MHIFLKWVYRPSIKRHSEDEIFVCLLLAITGIHCNQFEDRTDLLIGVNDISTHQGLFYTLGIAFIVCSDLHFFSCSFRVFLFFFFFCTLSNE